MPRIVDTLFDGTSASGALLDTGAISTAQYEAILVFAVEAGAAAATGFTLQSVDDGGTALTFATPTNPGGNASVFASIMPGGTVNATVPKKTRVQITGGAASTARLFIQGVRNTAGA
jgi:hypothetical protein